MSNPFEPTRRGTRSRLLAFDAWLNSLVFGVFERIKDAYANYSARLERFNMRGVGRGVVELVSDGLTLGIAGLLVALSFAIPAFQATRNDWRSYQNYSVTFYDRYGKEIGHRGIRHDDGVPLTEIPDHMIQATLAIEDRRFYSHIGIDFMGTMRAVVANMRANGVVEGGSTLTQQLAKNVFLNNERTLERKIKEAFLAIWLEVNLTKSEILKLYFDRAYLGAGAFGVEAASRFYFNKSVRDVTLAEAAMLAGMFKAPTRFAPHLDLPAARARANVVLNSMVDAGFMTNGQVLAARRSPATAIDRSDENSPDYFLDWAYEEVQRLADGKAFSLTAKTTIDLGLQRTAENTVVSMLRQHGRARRVGQASMVLAETNGAVRAIVGGRDYGESQFNRGTRALRQPGSSFKVYVYMAALMNGYTPRSVVVDGPVSIGRWSPRNYSGGYRGRMQVITALTRSVNTVPVKLYKELGSGPIVEMVGRMGVETEMRANRALALGTSEVTVLDQVRGYLTLATGGRRTPAYGIEEIRTVDGDLLYSHQRDKPRPEQLLPPEKVSQMNEMLVNVVNAGTARRAQLPGIVAAGKTGTSQAYRDAWFIGFTGNYVGGVWYGNDNFSPTGRITGGNLPAMTWQRVMEVAHQGIELKPIPGIGAPIAPLPALVEEDGIRTRAIARAPTLSRAAAQVLRDLSDEMRRAPPMRGAGGLSSLPAPGTTVRVGSRAGDGGPSANTVTR